MKVDFNLEARWELCLGLIKKSSSPPSHRHLSKKYQHTLPIAAKFNLAPPTSHSLMLWIQKNGLSMSLIRTQGLLTTDKVPQWGREKILRKKNSRPRSNGYDSKTKRDPTAKNVVFHKTKMALYCPQGSGTLRQQLLSMHGIAWYCMVLHYLAPSCTILHYLELSCTILQWCPVVPIRYSWVSR